MKGRATFQLESCIFGCGNILSLLLQVCNDSAECHRLNVITSLLLIAHDVALIVRYKEMFIVVLFADQRSLQIYVLC